MFLKVSPLAQQACTISSVLFFNIGCGMMADESTPNPNPSNQKEDPSTKLYESTLPNTYALGLLWSAYLMHRYGTRTAHSLATISAIVTWITIYFADSTLTYTIGKVQSDFTKGAGIILGAMAIGECADSSHRGVFLTLAAASIAYGRMAACIIGDIKTIAIFALAPSIISFMIESLVCHTLTNKIEESHDLTKKLVEATNSRTQELQTLKDFVKSLKSIVKPLVVITYADILMEASGKHFYEFFGSQIFDIILGNSLFTNYNFFINTIVTSSIIFSSFLVKVFKMRTVIFLSGTMSVMVLFIISFILFLPSNVLIEPWIMISLITVYIILINFGCTTTFLIWCGELFPKENKSLGLLLSGIIFFINKTVCSKIKQCGVVGLTSLKYHCVVGISTVTLILLTLYHIAPETKNRSLAEIEEYFEKYEFEENDEETNNVISV